MKGRLLGCVLAIALLTSCGSKTRENSAAGGDGKAVAGNETIRILSQSSYQSKASNVLRDQLTKAGFNVELNTQPDYSSYLVPLKAGDYDLAITGWTTVTGNPDYAVRSLFMTGGDYNNLPVSDAKVDQLIDKAAAETPEQYVETYRELENYLVSEKAYIVPLYSNLRILAYNKELIKNNVRHSKSRSLVWEEFEYNDSSLNEKRPLILTQNTANLTSLWPIKGNDGSINQLNTNMYVRLVNLTDEDDIIAEGSLSYSNVIAEGNKEYYFLLRDDVYFAAVDKNKNVVNTGERVGVDDVIFSLNNARDKNSAPDHRTFTLHGSMESIEAITDLNILKTGKKSGTNTSILSALQESAPTSIKALTADKTKANTKDGVYQVIRIITKRPFPQVLNFLAHQSAGITSVKQVTKVNKDLNVKTYDPKKDVIYGDQSTVTEGSTYNNTLWCSGPYILVKKNEYDIIFMKNPGYMVGSKHEPRIKQITYKVIADNASAVGAFRAGEVDFVPAVDDDKVEILEGDAKVLVSKRSSNSVIYAAFNLKDGSKFRNQKLRQAVLNAVEQEGFIAVYSGLKQKAYSTLSTLIDTGNELKVDLEKSRKLLLEYQNEK
ncbi:hypothetical protein E4N83_01750 [Treponema denticola]|uniref:ABC transporter substrate-binding protein n=1 Tax=Treponema denticola TaxID=158 RepID=UPI0020A4E4A7|nr:ABC transporter substrate-binding protein [Treponema denticola]UTC97038.1 hypothetical protein E4N83_01750 [Treponema denticola]UTD06734.1 hypothetical protein E4N90_01795 [Treponema denticola]